MAGEQPVERRVDYRHIKMTWTLLGVAAAFFTMLGGAVVWLGGSVISPGANVEVLGKRIDKVSDSLVARAGTLDVRLHGVEKDHRRISSRVDFLVTVKCQEIDAATRRVLAAAGFSCAEMTREARENGN